VLACFDFSDIPYDIQPGERTVYQVEATDADSGQNAEIEYLIDHTTWTLNNQENPVSVSSVLEVVRNSFDYFGRIRKCELLQTY